MIATTHKGKLKIAAVVDRIIREIDLISPAPERRTIAAIAHRPGDGQRLTHRALRGSARAGKHQIHVAARQGAQGVGAYFDVIGAADPRQQVGAGRGRYRDPGIEAPGVLGITGQQLQGLGVENLKLAIELALKRYLNRCPRRQILQQDVFAEVTGQQRVLEVLEIERTTPLSRHRVNGGRDWQG